MFPMSKIFECKKWVAGEVPGNVSSSPLHLGPQQNMKTIVCSLSARGEIREDPMDLMSNPNTELQSVLRESVQSVIEEDIYWQPMASMPLGVRERT